MTAPERAVELFDSQYNCAQAVAGACGPVEGVDEATCLIASAAFGGGMCRMADTCGAVTGALIVIGLRHGKVTLLDPTRKGEVYAAGAQFIDRFRVRHGTTVCRELLGCDISTPEGAAQARREDMHHSRCTQYVRDAAQILTDML